jgi:hypothetical protein
VEREAEIDLLNPRFTSVAIWVTRGVFQGLEESQRGDKSWGGKTVVKDGRGIGWCFGSEGSSR